MSTKLTARKRYLPRILKAVPILSSFKLNSVTPEESKAYFSSDAFSDLIRAMNLYGFSLRQGEAPDDTSRKAEQLTDSFNKVCSTYVKSSKASDLESCLQIFEDYKDFSKLSN